MGLLCGRKNTAGMRKWVCLFKLGTNGRCPVPAGHSSTACQQNRPLHSSAARPHLRAIAAGVQPALKHAVRVCAGIAALAGALQASKGEEQPGTYSNFGRERQRQRRHWFLPPKQHSTATGCLATMQGSMLGRNRWPVQLVGTQTGRHGTAARALARDHGPPCGNRGRARHGT